MCKYNFYFKIKFKTKTNKDSKCKKGEGEGKKEKMRGNEGENNLAIRLPRSTGQLHMPFVSKAHPCLTPFWQGPLYLPRIQGQT